MTAGPEAHGGDTPLRADARRNRDQIISAAKAIFASDGPDVPMEEIARLAAVGVGTLYRRFPDREALIRAVARDNFATALAAARAAAAEEPTAWAALVRLLNRSGELQLSVRLATQSPLGWAIIREDPVTEDFRDALLATLDGVVRAAQAEGSLRPDVGTGDVALLLSLQLRRLSFLSDEDARTAADRALGIMLDGLRARPGTAPPSPPLPGHPLSAATMNPKNEPGLGPNCP
jgi:AcrR family transcriptional regulator